MVYKTPAGVLNGFCEDLLNQPHLLIAGATGSGKSVLVNAIVYNALYYSPVKVQFILLDPKRVELSMYRALPHTIRYACEQNTMIAALQYALNITETRYKRMQRARQRKSTESHIYVIIDEMADLMTTNKKAVEPLIQRICQIGRAANIHCIACTQSPLSKIISTPIKCNMDARVGLRTRNAQDSRNILDCNGCESLPRYGKGIYLNPAGCGIVDIPYYPDNELETRVNYWTRQKPLLARLFTA